jgi:hypothetical protein
MNTYFDDQGAQYDKEGNVKTGGQKTITRSLNQEYSKSSIGTVRLQYWTVYMLKAIWLLVKIPQILLE